MNKQQETKPKKLGIFTLPQAANLGLSHRNSLDWWLQKNKRVSRAIHLHPGADLETDVGFQIACTKSGPEAAIGGLSARFHYNLAVQVPGPPWVMVPTERKTRESEYKLIRTKVGLDKGVATENGYRIVLLERAILEGLKFITKIGERTAVKAAQFVSRGPGTQFFEVGQTIPAPLIQVRWGRTMYAPPETIVLKQPDREGQDQHMQKDSFEK